MFKKIMEQITNSVIAIIVIMSIMLTVLEFKIIGYVEDEDIILLFISNIFTLLFISTLIGRISKRSNDNVEK